MEHEGNMKHQESLENKLCWNDGKYNYKDTKGNEKLDAYKLGFAYLQAKHGQAWVKAQKDILTADGIDKDWVSFVTQEGNKPNLRKELENINFKSESVIESNYLESIQKIEDKYAAQLKNAKKKKNTFIKIVMPLILDENNKILENRKKLFKILGKSTNSMGEKRWLKRRFKEYGIKKGDITELKVRMDIIPPSIAIAQAAVESGWGTSRFALEGNAMFGQWTWSKNGIEPTEKSKNQDHKILKFSMLRSSVKAYKNNLNTHRGYREFREKRAELRKNNKKISGLKLVNYLYNYAATGKEYTKILKRTIDQNGLTDFDDATLMNSGKSLPARESLIL